MNDQKLDELIKLADSYENLNSLAEKLQKEYHEISNRLEIQNRELEQTNQKLTDALLTNNRLSLYLNNILECLDAGVIVFDRNGIINLFNRAAETLTGVGKEQALNRSYDDVFTEPQHGSTYELLRGEQTSVRGEKWYNNQPVGYSSKRIFDSARRFSGVVEILYDIKSEKKLRETISHVSALAALGEMAATVAHQVRNPLAGIVGFCDLLMMDLDESHPSAGTAKKISRGAKDLNRIITNLLEFTRKTEPSCREIDLVEFLGTMVISLQKEPYAKNTEIVFESDLPNQNYQIDPVLFRQVVINLVQNACQSIDKKGGNIHIKLANNDKDYLTIEFADSGPGIPEDIKGEIFKPFFTTRARGTGLGLSMVKKVIDLHNGKITFTPSAGGGAGFKISLPL